jgi:NAD(P)-dependent dehydrogenase (short-subunit alcohol dehydrogenase family)
MKSALVTGGSAGIGLAIAHMLAEEGHGVSILARSVDALTRSAMAIDAHAIVGDVAREQDCRDAVQRHVERFGGLDVLVCSAGVSEEEPVADLTVESIDRQISINLRGTLLIAREAVTELRARRGLIVTIASALVNKPSLPGLAVYTATKAAIISATRGFAAELGPSGVRATALIPGLVNTGMADGYQLSREMMVQPGDCAEVVRTLLRLSPHAYVPEVTVTTLDRSPDPRG